MAWQDRICYWMSGGWGYKWWASEPIVRNNENPALYVEDNDIKYYNSALYVNGSDIYIFALSEVANTLHLGKGSGTEQNIIFLQFLNNVYGRIYYDNDIPYTGKANNFTDFDGAIEIPVFYTKNEYISYITSAPIQYTWQSVPSISGKNGILQSLVQIKEEALNDGEPVSEATVLSFDSLGNINIPNIIDEQMPVDPSDVTSVTATYLIPALENGTYEGIKLLVKKGSIPTSEEDADKVVNLDEPTSILRIDSKSVGNLDEDSHYYFMVKLIDELGTEATSEPKDIWTSHSEGWNYDYTGSIQTFVAPKTGIYSLETWGAQGGDATDGTLVARGGYGAYAVGEVFLTQGDTLYINVGGQNGYGGGGNYIPQATIYENGVCNPEYFEDGQYKTITIVAVGGNHSVTFNSNNIEIQNSSGAYNTQRAVFTVFDGIEIPEEFTKVKVYGRITFGPVSPSYGGLSYYIQDNVETGAYEYIQEHPSVYHMNDYHIGGTGASSWSGDSISDEYDFVWESGIGNIESTFGGRYIGVLTNCLHQCASCNIKITKIVIEGE